jgi:hypothetical protein
MCASSWSRMAPRMTSRLRSAGLGVLLVTAAASCGGPASDQAVTSPAVVRGPGVALRVVECMRGRGADATRTSFQLLILQPQSLGGSTFDLIGLDSIEGVVTSQGSSVSVPLVPRSSEIAEGGLLLRAVASLPPSVRDDGITVRLTALVLRERATVTLVAPSLGGLSGQQAMTPRGTVQVGRVGSDPSGVVVALQFPPADQVGPTDVTGLAGADLAIGQQALRLATIGNRSTSSGGVTTEVAFVTEGGEEGTASLVLDQWAIATRTPIEATIPPGGCQRG